MGQSWRIVDVDVLYTIRGGGKLGEWIWGNQSELVNAITKPRNITRPGGPKVRLGWESNTTGKLSSAGSLGKLPTRSIQTIFKCIARYRDAMALASTCTFLWTQGKEEVVALFYEDTSLDRLIRSAGPFFGKLPAELVRMIFNELDEYPDAFYLALTCRFMWLGGEPHVYRLLAELKAPSAGSRLMATGDYAYDLPPSLCKPERLDAIFHGLGLRGSKDLKTLASVDYDFDPSVLEASCERHKSRHAGNGQSNQRSKCKVTMKWEDLTEVSSFDDGYLLSDEPLPNRSPEETEKRRRAKEQQRGLAQGIWHLATGWPPSTIERASCYKMDSATLEIPGAEHWIPDRLQHGFPHDRDKSVYLLRNISKQLYMRSDNRLAERDKYCGFGRALLAHICWSKASTSLAYDGPVHRGKWAGDQVDVVPFNPQGCEARTWKDVTEDMIEEVKRIFQPEDQWRRIYRDPKSEPQTGDDGDEAHYSDWSDSP